MQKYLEFNMWTFLLVIALGAIVMAVCTPTKAGAQEYTIEDSLAAIEWAADKWGVSEATMLRVARCESDFDAHARGDFRNGAATSFGLYQLNNRPGTGLLDHFHQFYPTAWSPWASAAYFARVLAGEWPDIRPSRWSCY